MGLSIKNYYYLLRTLTIKLTIWRGEISHGDYIPSYVIVQVEVINTSTLNSSFPRSRLPKNKYSPACCELANIFVATILFLVLTQSLDGGGAPPVLKNMGR